MVSGAVLYIYDPFCAALEEVGSHALGEGWHSLQHSRPSSSVVSLLQKGYLMEHQDFLDIVRDVCVHCGARRTDHGNHDCDDEQTVPAPGCEVMIRDCPGFEGISDRQLAARRQANEFMRAVTQVPFECIL